MSSILKALKKVEEERAARQGESADFARSLLRSNHRRRRSGYGLLLWGVILLLPIGAWWLSRPDAAPVQNPTVIANPLAAEPALVADTPPPAAAEPPVAAKRLAADAEVVEVIFSAPVIQAASRPGPTVPVSQSLPLVSTPAAPELPTEQPRQAAERRKAAEPPPLSLQLSGIAWQEEREARLAIIDDLPVMEGTMIDGVMVEEILRDRVRFSQGGRIIELMVE
jgi:general secretion pathway protein B